MFSRFSVRKPLTVFVGVILIIILGVVSFSGMNTDLLPSIDLPYVIVMTTYIGAAPEKVEASVTKPLESSLATTGGLENISSISSENYSTIILEFAQDINMDSVMIDLSNKIDAVKASMEEGVGNPMLMKLNPDMLPVMVASVDVEGMDIKEASALVQEDIIPSLERVDGVASIDTTGLLEESIVITLDNKKIQKLNDRVLASVDSKLVESKSQIDSAKKQLQEGKKVLEKESASQIEGLVNTSMALEEGKLQLHDAINSLPGVRKELEQQKNAVSAAKDALTWIIDSQETIGVPVSGELSELQIQLANGEDELSKGIEAIDTQAPELEEQLKTILENQKLLEIGKLTLNRELTKASVSISLKEEELAKGEVEFEAAAEKAYKEANLDGMITKDMLSKLIKAQNFSMPAGYISENDDSFIVKVGDKVNTLKEMKSLPLINIPVEGIGIITLKEVADIQIIDNSKDMFAKINGNDGVILSISKQSTSSTSEVSKSLNKAIKNITDSNSSVHVTPLSDQGVYIDVVVNSVINNLILGGILAIIVLFVFLKSIKPTVIIAFSIPISVLFAITMMYFSGVTLNIISLSGLALGVGMLVDNSIVVIENIYRLRNEGVNAASAAVKGAVQVAGAIAASTLTTVCVFLPIVFTHGLSRQLFADMGLTIAYSLGASLIVALTLVPAMASTILVKVKEQSYSLFERFTSSYERLLRLTLRHKSFILMGALIILVGSGYFCISKGFILIPSMDSSQITVTLEMPKGTGAEETRKESLEIIDRITTLEDVETVGALQSTSQGGMALLGGGGSDTSCTFYVILKEDKKLSSDEIGKDIENLVSDLQGDISVNTQAMDMSALGGSGVNVMIKGSDMDRLTEISEDVMDIMSEVDGTYEVSNGMEDSSVELRIKVDKNKAMKYGLTVAQVYQEVALAITEDLSSGSINLGDKEYSIVLKEDISTINRANLKHHVLKVKENEEEKEIKLSEIAEVTEDLGANVIRHDSQSRYISVTALVDDDHNVALVSEKIEDRLKSYNLPEGYTVEMKGEIDSIKSSFSDLIKMIALAIVFIYLIMVAQFQSLLSPFIVMFTIPLAFTGGFLALLITGKELSIIAMLGFLMLSGVIVNNGIVFVDYVNQLRLQGMDKKEALVEAGKTRIRPILMTALTTILGLTTLAMGMGADMVQPMAIVTIGGLIYATILTLFVVPVMYDILHKKELKPIIIDEEDLKN